MKIKTNNYYLKNEWYIALSSEELKKNQVLSVKRFGMDLVFWRDSKNEVHAADARCPHRGANLGLGNVVNDCLQCPYHGFLFDGDGKALLIPSLGKSAKINPHYRAKSYRVKEFMNFIFIWYGEGEPYKKITWLDGIDESFSYLTMKAVWNVNYTRAIENQLDVSHLPFVHKTTIGRGGKTLVNGPIVELQNNTINVWVCNEVDTGQKPKKPDEIDKNGCTGRLQFIFPNYWQNIISNKLRIMAAFVPQDEYSTIIYIRLYQKFLKIPLLDGLFNRLMMYFNKIVLNQDKNVVESQYPKISDIRNRELLVYSDLPIILYRKYMYKNLEQNDF
ncbi:MAG: Rieske 2Fe-2S domain-containing protein [Nitrososphaeria archaeon]